MKPHRDASELAARIGAAASKPLPLPEPANLTLVPIALSAAAPKPEATGVTPKKVKRVASETETETVQMSIRPSRATLTRYILAAADRTRETGRVVSAQEMMIEQLERAR